MAFMACGGGSENSLLGDAALTTELDSMCYAIGASFSKSMRDGQMKLDGEQVTKGYIECMKGESYINEENVREISNRIQQEMGKMQGGAPGAGVAGMNVDSLSYAIGSSYYLQLKSMGMEMNHQALAKGIQDNLKEKGSLLDEAKIEALLGRFGAMAQKAQAEKAAADAAVNKEKGKAFLEEKAKEDGVKSTPSGLMYKVMKEGNGKMPKETDKVSVHYEGRLIDGTVFDSSIERGEPTEFPLNRVIKGWTEGVQLMKAGAKYQFYIPSDLAYGDQGAGADIPAGATLIFEVELLEVK